MLVRARKMSIVAIATLSMLLLVGFFTGIGLKADYAYASRFVAAGGDFDYNGIVSGLNGNGTADPGATLTVKLNDLESRAPGIKSAYGHGAIKIYWQIAGSETEVNPDYSSADGGTFSIYLDESYADKTITFFTSGNYDSTNYNNNAAPVKVNSLVAHIVKGPSIDSVKVGGSPVSKIVQVYTGGYGEYYTINEYNTDYVYERTIVLSVDGKQVASKTATHSSSSSIEVDFANVPVPYNKKCTLKVSLYMNILGTKVAGPSKSYTVSASSLGKNSVVATKISKRQAQVRWGGVAYATGYRIYQGSKMIKQVGSTTRTYAVKRAGAGSAKFKVVPILKSGSKVYTGTSTQAKPKSNVVSLHPSTSYRSASYMTCPFRMSKISLSGKTYTITGYAVNNRIWKMQLYKKLSLSLYVDGKKAFKKTLKNVKVNVGPSSSKKITVKVKGKAGMDLRNGVLYRSVSQTPKWVFSNGREVK